MAGRLKSNWSGAAAGACAVALAAALSACGNSGSGGGAGATSSPPQNAKAGSTTVTVQLTEYHLALSSKTFKAGDYTFVAKNAGHIVHSLEIEGQGTEMRLPHGLQPGQSAQLKVMLKKGSYELYCPVDGHKDMGMKAEITVGGGSGGSSGGGGSSTPGSGY
ncbi:cupredoxin domain-containing protein [Streptomyces sp. NPDC001435]|uniref:cupredoxin domain-containing protein n=1 Tax=Streptomyces sp. NPDC001435 TaxID=3364576 RepID=UPI0036ACC2A8